MGLLTEKDSYGLMHDVRYVPFAVCYFTTAVDDSGVIMLAFEFSDAHSIANLLFHLLTSATGIRPTCSHPAERFPVNVCCWVGICERLTVAPVQRKCKVASETPRWSRHIHHRPELPYYTRNQSYWMMDATMPWSLVFMLECIRECTRACDCG